MSAPAASVVSTFDAITIPIRASSRIRPETVRASPTERISLSRSGAVTFQARPMRSRRFGLDAGIGNANATERHSGPSRGVSVRRAATAAASVATA